MKKAQSILEYSILIIIIVAAFVTMQVYIKRGFQGRWKQAVDDLGDQYDKDGFSSWVSHKSSGSSESRTLAVPASVDGQNGIMTLRTDNSTSTENKTGWSLIDPAGL